MWVTHAFRKEGQDIGGTIVPPASKSNHLVGHAIDMNLDTPRIASQTLSYGPYNIVFNMKFEKHLFRGWCNSTCLAAESNTHAKCFTDAIQAHGPGLDL